MHSPNIGESASPRHDRPRESEIAVAATDLDALYDFLTTTIGPLSQITAVETTPLLATAKRTGLIRRA